VLTKAGGSGHPSRGRLTEDERIGQGSVQGRRPDRHRLVEKAESGQDGEIGRGNGHHPHRAGKVLPRCGDGGQEGPQDFDGGRQARGRASSSGPAAAEG